MKTALAKAENEPNRRWWHDTRSFVSDLKELLREPAVFSAQEMSAPEREKFMTQDEVDLGLVGGASYSDSKWLVFIRDTIGAPYTKVVLRWNKVAERIAYLAGGVVITFAKEILDLIIG